MPDDPNSCFSPAFIAEFEAAVLTLPGDHQRVTWANSEKGLVAALVGPPRSSFVVALEEGLVMLIDKQAGQKLQTWPVAEATGGVVVCLMQDVIGKRVSQPAQIHQATAD